MFFDGFFFTYIDAICSLMVFFTYIDTICSFSGCCSMKLHGIIGERNDDDSIVCDCFYCCQPVLVHISIGCKQLLKGDCIKSINALSKKKESCRSLYQHKQFNRISFFIIVCYFVLRLHTHNYCLSNKKMAVSIF
jgi:hypothetical protein